MSEGKKYPFDFSVIMAVYNVEKYLAEAIDSLILQTIGFQRIQLILVDDGASDSSGSICDEYATKYAQNILVIHKENGGVASARNAGLPYAKGRYLNFMDPDDKMTSRTFSLVYSFFSRHEAETDICTIPLYFFDGQKGQHWQNYKFDNGSRVIDLFKEYRNTLMVVAPSFFSNEVKDKICFDSHLVCGEDIKVCLEILKEKMTLGVVHDAGYLYRRRQDENNKSLIQSAKTKKGWYEDYFTYLFDWSVETYQQKFGGIPAFLQYELMSDLQWRFKEDYEKDMLIALNNDQGKVKKYKERLRNALIRIEDPYILEMSTLSQEQKFAILKMKYSCSASLLPQKGNVLLKIGNTTICSLSEMRTVWEFLFVNQEKNTIILEGFHEFLDVGDKKFQPCVLVNDLVVACECVNRDNEAFLCLGEPISTTVGFRVEIPLQEHDMTICPAVMFDEIPVSRTNVMFGDFFPISDTYENAYVEVFNKLITLRNKNILVSNLPMLPGRLKREALFLNEVWKKNLLGGRKAVAGRIYYHLLKPLKQKQIWIISDRITKADDNGEALFHYVSENKPKSVKVVFAISRKTSDYQRIKKIGKCVDALSFQHKLLHLLCDVNISSQADAVTVNPFHGYHDAVRDLLYPIKFVFLQHGITQNDISGWLNRYNKNIAGFITAAYSEQDSIVNGHYFYEKEQVWLTGFCRFDWIYHNEQKKITLMPTWRRYLTERVDPQSGLWFLKKDFNKSDYYQFYNALINSERLLEALYRHGYSLQFFPHPTLQPYISIFQHDPRVAFLSMGTSYRDVYAMSNLVISDYSSAVFDFSYMRKPIIYCQFDKEEFFKGDHVCREGYFDYEKDGFGEVEYDLESTIDRIIEYVEHDCHLKEIYRQRIDKFFAYNDQNNSRRVMERILSLSGGVMK